MLLFGGLLLGDGMWPRHPSGACPGRRGDPSLAGLPGPADAIQCTWVSAQATGLRIAASLAALVFVMLQRYTPELILWTTAGLLVVLFVIEIFAADEQSPLRGSGCDPDHLILAATAQEATHGIDPFNYW